MCVDAFYHFVHNVKFCQDTSYTYQYYLYFSIVFTYVSGVSFYSQRHLVFTLRLTQT